MNGFIDGGGETPPLLFENLEPRDAQALFAQMKGRAFDISIVRGVAKRCRWQKPQVIVCSPLKAGKPFPTTFWLTCPFLDRKCGQLESEGGVGELEGLLSEPAMHGAWIAFNEKLSMLRASLLSCEQKLGLLEEKPALMENLRHLGIGGIKAGEKPWVKCLHLQVAAWLGTGFHPAGEWLEEKLGDLDCAGAWLERC
jgi:hypothetical protein